MTRTICHKLPFLLGCTGCFMGWLLLVILLLAQISSLAAPTRRRSATKHSSAQRSAPPATSSIALLKAVQKKDLAAVQRLLAKGANPNAADARDMTPLMIAIQNEHGVSLPIVQALLAKGANPNAKTKEGRVALHDAVYTHSVPLIQALICKGANVNVSEQYGQTPLERAVSMGDVPVVKLLLSAGAKLRLDAKNRPMLTIAATYGNVGIAKLLLAKGARVNESDAGGTALMAAAQYGHTAMVKFLLSKGAIVNAKDEEGETALFHASSSGYLAVAQALVAAGANVNGADKEGSTPLVGAVISGMGDPEARLVKLLLDHGANPNAGREPPLLWAAQSGSTKAVQILLDKGAKADVTGFSGTPLLAVLREGNRQRSLMILYGFGGTMSEAQRAKVRQRAMEDDASIVRALLEHGVDVKQEPNRGALVLAAASGNTPVVQLLLDKGAPLDVTDLDEGALTPSLPGEQPQALTPLMLAARGGHSETVQILLNKGADANAKDRAGKTALIHVAEEGKSRTVRFLAPMREAVLHRANEDSDKPVNREVSAQEKREWQQWAETADAAIIQALLAQNADVNARDNKGRTTLMAAVINSSHAVVQALLQAKAQVNAQDSAGATALMRVVEAGRIQQAPELFSRELATQVEMAKRYSGPDPKAAKQRLSRVSTAFNQQKTAVLQEAAADDLAMIKTLIAAGADVSALDKKGRTVLTIVSALTPQSHYTTIVTLLQDHLKQRAPKP